MTNSKPVFEPLFVNTRNSKTYPRPPPYIPPPLFRNFVLSLCHPILQFGLANIFFNFLNFVFTLGHPRPPKRCPNWMLIFVVMGDQVQDDMSLKFLIFTLGKILQNFFSKIDGNSRTSPQCEKSQIFFILLFWASNIYATVQT